MEHSPVVTDNSQDIRQALFMLGLINSGGCEHRPTYRISRSLRLPRRAPFTLVHGNWEVPK